MHPVKLTCFTISGQFMKTRWRPKAFLSPNRPSINRPAQYLEMLNPLPCDSDNMAEALQSSIPSSIRSSSGLHVLMTALCCLLCFSWDVVFEVAS